MSQQDNNNADRPICKDSSGQLTLALQRCRGGDSVAEMPKATRCQEAGKEK